MTAMESVTLTLYSDGLLSKWGFHDGDLPDHVRDYLDHLGIENVDWHATLRLLVRRHLLPALDQRVEVYDIETAHNPIRASRVNDIPIDDTADNDSIALTPDHVMINWEQIRDAMTASASDRGAQAGQ